MANPTETTPLKELNDKTPDSSKCKASLAGGTPDCLNLPKPFKFPERYTSPTDRIMSPISKGILARNRRGGPLLPPSKIQPKINESQSPKVGQVQLKMDESENNKDSELLYSTL